VDRMFQVQSQEDAGSSARQRWTQTSGLWPVCSICSNKAFKLEVSLTANLQVQVEVVIDRDSSVVNMLIRCLIYAHMRK